jgi:hypothetical protein
MAIATTAIQLGGSMAQFKRKVWAIVAASCVMSSTAFIAATEREASGLAPAQQEQFRASIAQAIATVPAASASTPAARASLDQDPPQGRRPRASEGCSCGMPRWLKYSLVGVAAAGGGFALSQIGNHEGGDRGPDHRAGGQRR